MEGHAWAGAMANVGAYIGPSNLSVMGLLSSSICTDLIYSKKQELGKK